MVNKKFWLGMLVIVLVFGMAVVGCDGGSKNDDDPYVPPYVPPVEPPLTGEVSVTSKITTVSAGIEKMTLTVDISDLPGGSSYLFSFQWMRDGVNINNNATSAAYEVTTNDIGKTLKVKVTRSGYTGEVFGEFSVPNPTICTLTLKWASDAGKQDTYIVIENEDGTYWASNPSGSSNLTTSGSTVTLTSWTKRKFKMRTNYSFIELKYYFKKDNESGDELFDFTNGTKTYTLTNKYQTAVLYDLFATEE